MHRKQMITALVLSISLGTVGGFGLAQGNPPANKASAATQVLAPRVARLAQELGVSLDGPTAVDPWAGLHFLLRPLHETVSRIDFTPEEFTMELALRDSVGQLQAILSERPLRDGEGTALHRLEPVLDGLVSILSLRSSQRRTQARPEGSTIATFGTGSISGTVTRHGFGSLLEGVQVHVFDVNGSNAGMAITDAAGTYTVSGLGTGTYFAVTYKAGDSYIDELYVDTVCFSPWNCPVTSGTPITVTDGVETAGINFGLERGAYVLGNVGEEGTYVALTSGIAVSAFDTSGVQASYGRTTEPSGRYTIYGLPAGDYFLLAGGSGYVTEIHDEIPTAGNLEDIFLGTPVHVTEGGMPPIVDFYLAPAGSIEGTVTEQGTGTPIANANIYVYEADGTQLPRYTLFSDVTGAFTVGQLPSGSYFATSADYLHIRELWDDNPCPSCDVTSGTPIVVTQPSPTTGIHFELEKGGRILGTVTVQGSSTPLEGAMIYVYDGAGFQVDSGYTAADGTYATWGALPTGTYYVVAYDSVGGYIPELYLDTRCLACSPTSGTGVGVTAPDDTTGIDFSLSPGGRIEGAVTIEGWGDPLADAYVSIYDAGGTLVGMGAVWDGVYQSGSGLPTGTYVAIAEGPAAGVGLQSELFDDMPCPYDSCDPTTGTSISVTSPSTTSNVDFDLPLGARIAGVVKDASGGFPVSGMSVDIFDGGGTFVATATSNNYGVYATEGLANGTYYALAEDNTGGGYGSELYDSTPCDGCDVTTGTAIVISSTSTYDGVDFSLSASSVCSGETHLDLTSSSPVSGAESFEACETITAGGTFGIESPGDVELRAGLKIIMTNGFFVGAGATVELEIDPSLIP